MLPGHTCREGQYFRECFDVTGEQCNDTMTSLFDACLERYRDRLSDTIKLLGEGSRWGQVLGSCAGSQYDMERRSERIHSPRRNNPNEWM